MLRVMVGSNGAAASTATGAGIASGAGAGRVAVWNFLAAAGVDHVHDPVGRSNDRSIGPLVCRRRSGCPIHARYAAEQQPTGTENVCGISTV